MKPKNFIVVFALFFPRSFVSAPQVVVVVVVLVVLVVVVELVVVVGKTPPWGRVFLRKKVYV